jgi:hypothetical protein
VKKLPNFGFAIESKHDKIYIQKKKVQIGVFFSQYPPKAKTCTMSLAHIKQLE